MQPALKEAAVPCLPVNPLRTLPCVNTGAPHKQKEKSRFEVADIFREYGESYRSKHTVPPPHLKIMSAIEVCRTKYLGGHLDKCDSCGFEQNAYNSCRNRHCPKCQTLTKERWLEDRKSELLPVGYFHEVFTLPHELNPLILHNKEVIYGLLFKAVSETLLEFGVNPKHLGGKTGFLCILHTWDQKMLCHIHLHIVIPAGAVSFDETRWIHPREDYLFPVKALSKKFRGKFLDFLKNEFKEGKLVFPEKTDHPGMSKGFSGLINRLWKKDWVVYSRKPFAGPEKVLEYLGRYTHKVAISNHRIVSVDKSKVTFTYRDRRDSDKVKKTTITAEKFISRFLLHVLPKGFMKIRYFGFLSNRDKKANVNLCKVLLGHPPELMEKTKKSINEIMMELTGTDISLCPSCKKGTMRITEVLLPVLKRFKPEPVFLDSS